jgi:hypothetical protein
MPDGGVQLELLTGIYDPQGMGSMLFARALRDKGTPMPRRYPTTWQVSPVSRWFPGS